MSAILDVVKPDLSHFVTNGKFDAERAFDDYLCSIQLFIFPAMKMLEHSNCDSCQSALAFLEALNAGAVSMEEELIRIRSDKAA